MKLSRRPRRGCCENLFVVSRGDAGFPTSRGDAGELWDGDKVSHAGASVGTQLAASNAGWLNGWVGGVGLLVANRTPFIH